MREIKDRYHAEKEKEMIDVEINEKIQVYKYFLLMLNLVCL